MTLGSPNKGNNPKQLPLEALISSIPGSLLFGNGSDSMSSDSGSESDTGSRPNNTTGNNNANVNERSANASPRNVPSRNHEVDPLQERLNPNTTSRNNTGVSKRNTNSSPRSPPYHPINSPQERVPNVTIGDNNADVNNRSANAFPRFHYLLRGINSPQVRVPNVTIGNNNADVNNRSANASPGIFPPRYHEVDPLQERINLNTTARNYTLLNQQSANASPRIFQSCRRFPPQERRYVSNTGEDAINLVTGSLNSRHQVDSSLERRKRRRVSSTREDVGTDTLNPKIKEEHRIPFLIGKLVETVMIKLSPPSAKQFMNRILTLMTEFDI